LNEAESGELLNRFSALGEIEPHYSFLQGIMITDLPTIELYFRSAGELKRVSVYGGFKWAGKTGATVPMALVENLGYLASYSHPRATDWSPAYLEVMVWPYDYAPGEPIVWPEGFPDIESPATIKRGDSSYSIYLPYNMQQRHSHSPILH
jgi:hypothetical protein